MKQTAIALLLLGPAWASAAAAADVWRVVEGRHGEIKGAWVVEIEGDRLEGTANMFDPLGERTTYNVSGTRENGEYVVRRLDPGDHRDCSYGGPPDAKGAIAGAWRCGAESGPWRVERVELSQ